MYLYTIKQKEAMKNIDANKLNKALELIKKAQQLLNEVSKSDENFRCSANKNFRNNRISAAIEIVELEKKEFTK